MDRAIQRMESTHYDQFRTADNEGGQQLIPQKGMQLKVVYLLYGVLVLLLLILLLITGLKFSQLNQDLIDVKLSLETLDKSVLSAQAKPAGSSAAVDFNFEDFAEPEKGTCDEDWVHFQSSCYLLSPSEANWTEAEKLCLSHGSHLAIINTVEELKYISRITKYMHHFWIGLVEREQEGQWIWIDGTNFNTPNLWDIGQPDNWDYRENGEDCGQLHPPKSGNPNLKLLNDSDCTLEFRYICEATGK